jgi:hypothetical protein
VVLDINYNDITFDRQIIAFACACVVSILQRCDVHLLLIRAFAWRSILPAGPTKRRGRFWLFLVVFGFRIELGPNRSATKKRIQADLASSGLVRNMTRSLGVPRSGVGAGVVVAHGHATVRFLIEVLPDAQVVVIRIVRSHFGRSSFVAMSHFWPCALVMQFVFRDARYA